MNFVLYLINETIKNMKNSVKKVGGWYKVSIQGVEFNVFTEETHYKYGTQEDEVVSVVDPNKIMVFDEGFNIVDGTPTFLGLGFYINEHVRNIMVGGG